MSTGTLKRAAIFAVFAVAAAAMAFSLVGRDTATRANETPGTLEVAEARLPLKVEPAQFRRAFNSSNFGPTKEGEAEKRFDVDVVFPTTALGAAREGVYLPESADLGDGTFMAVYENDVMVRVTRFATAEEASGYLSTFRRAELQDHVKKIKVHGNDGYQVERVSIAPVPGGPIDPESGLGPVEPGTGVYSSASAVAWQQGKFIVEVCSPSHSSDQLMDVASGTWLETR